MPYWVRLGIVFVIVSFVFIAISIGVKIGFMGTVDVGIPFPFHHLDSTPAVIWGGKDVVDSDHNRFLPVGVGLDLCSYLLASVLILRVVDSYRIKRK